jgi:hypothetical protein
LPFWAFDEGRESNDPLATFECSLDGVAFQACASPKDYTDLPFGARSFRVCAKDAAGNVDESPATHLWTIEPPPQGCTAPPLTACADRDAWILQSAHSSGPHFRRSRPAARSPAPRCACTPAPTRRTGRSRQSGSTAAPRSGSRAPSGWSNQPAPASGVTPALAESRNSAGYLEWNVTAQMVGGYGNNKGFLIRDANENGGGMEQGFTAARRVLTIRRSWSSPSGPRRKRLTTRCWTRGSGWRARAGRRTPISRTGSTPSMSGRPIARQRRARSRSPFTWTVDTLAPVTTIEKGPPAVTNSASAAFEFGASEAASFVCRLDAGDWAACASRGEYAGLADGEHTHPGAGDGPGRQRGPEGCVYIDDRHGGAGDDHRRGPSDPSSDRAPSFEFSADETAGFECRLAEGDWTACTSPQDRTGFAQPLDARARVYARAVAETARGAGWGNAGAVASTRTGADDGATALRPISATRATGRGVAPALVRIG